jgi:hypothetical protein
VFAVEEAAELYLAAFRQQFPGPFAAKARVKQLSCFLAYLQTHHHSMQLIDLGLEDGRAFLDTLVNAYTRKPVSLPIRQKYKSALRSFSRFLVTSNLIEEDIFFALKAE